MDAPKQRKEAMRKDEPTATEIYICATDLVRMESACIEWGATPDRSVELADMRIRELLQMPQRFAHDREGEVA
jgi:hypothetical protein